MTTLPSGQVLVVGGMTEGGASLTSVELLDPVRNKMREVGSLAQPRVSHTATLLPDGRVIIAASYSDDNRNTNGVWRFQPE